MAGGTPPGKLAITLDAGKLKGVHDLKEGDHVVLLASISVDMPGAGHSNCRAVGDQRRGDSRYDFCCPSEASSGLWCRMESW